MEMYYVFQQLSTEGIMYETLVVDHYEFTSITEYVYIRIFSSNRLEKKFLLFEKQELSRFRKTLISNLYNLRYRYGVL